MNFLHDILLPFLRDLAAQSAKASLLACAVALVCLLPRRWLSSAWRHVLWCAVFARLVLPDLPTPWTSWSVSQMLAEPIASLEVRPDSVAAASGASSLPVLTTAIDSPASIEPTQSAPALSSLPGTMTPPNKMPPQPISVSWWTILGILWLAGAMVWWLALGAAWFRFRRRVLARCTYASPQTEALLKACLKEARVRARVEIRCSEHIATPAVCGPLHPVILLPQALESALSEYELRLLLLHELGHVKRCDPLVQIFASLLLGLHWWNPALWFAWGRLKHEAEAATDAWVLHHTGPDTAPSYGGMLLDLTARACTLGLSLLFLPSLIGATSEGRRLRQRLTAIASHRPAGRRMGLLGLTTLTLLAAAGFSQNASAPKLSPAPKQASSPANPPTSTDSIGGILVDEKGQPIANAEVEIDIVRPRGKLTKSVLPAGYKDPAPVKTDNEGRWQLQGVPTGVMPSTSANILAGKDIFHIYAAHPDFLFTQFSSFGEPIPDDGVTFREGTAKLEMKRGLVLRGVVRDEAGKPIAGATIQRNLNTSANLTITKNGDPSVTSDAQGHYEMRNARPGSLTVRVHAAGFGVHVERVKMESETTQNFALKKAQTLTLKIRDDKDQPVTAYKDQRTPKPLVNIFAPGGGWKIGDRLWSSEGAEEDGVVVWEDAPPGELVADIEGRGFANVTRKVSAGGEILIKLTAADRLPTVTLKITDAATGAPLSGCTFNTGTVAPAAPDHYTASWGAGEGSDVSFRPSTVEGEYQGTLQESHLNREVVFSVRREGYIPAITSRILPKKGDSTVSMALQKGQPTKITVRDASGATVPGADVYVVWMSNYAQLRNFAVLPGFSAAYWDFIGATGAEGECLLPPFAGDAAVLVTHQSGFAVSTIADLARNQTVVLGLYAQIEAAVKREGKLMPGIKYEYFSTMELPGGHSVMHTITATSDTQGRITLPRAFPARLGGFKEVPPPGRPSLGTYMSQTTGWKRVPAGQTTLFDLETKKPQLRILKGRFMAPGGEFLTSRNESLLLNLNRLSDQGTPLPVGFTPLDEEGRFTFSELPPGDYTLTFTRTTPPPRYAFSSGTAGFPLSIPAPTPDAANKPVDLGDIPLVKSSP